MADIRRTEFKVEPWNTDRYQRLRKSELAKLFQIAAIQHTEELGAGRIHTFDRGFLWIISRISAEIKRPLMYGEELIFESWPGETMHIIFPRYYRLSTKEGEPIVKASSLWLLIDTDSRSVVFPDEHNIHIGGEKHPGEIPDPADLADFDAIETFQKKVQYSDLDLNAHVNNTKYFDWIDDLHSEEYHKNHFAEKFQINFRKELSPGSTLELGWKESGDDFRVKGNCEGNSIFTYRAKMKTL